MRVRPRLPLLLLACLALLACPRGTRPRDLGTRAVVIGIDSADWRIIEPLAAAGRLPNLVRLREAGVWGPIQTLSDIPLSPVVWTSIATGKSPAKHGIAWFMVDQPDGTRVPVRSYNRKTKAIWNIVAGGGRDPVVVGWWASYPAEPVGDGAIVSDGLGFHGFGATARGGDDGKKTYPAGLFRDLDPLVPPEQQLSYEFLRRFVHLTPEEYRAEMYDPARSAEHDPFNAVHLFQMYAVTAQGYSAIARRLLAERPYDLFMVYFEQVDSFSHLFMKYAPPRLPWVDEAGMARYQDVVAEWYVYQDELLGELLAEIDLGTTAVFLLSDHGFKSGERRIRSEQVVDVRRAHLEHEPDGVFVAAGPHIQKGGRIGGASVLDVTPTVLHYLGFPVAKDMDGKVLTEIFEPAFSLDNEIRYLASYEEGAAEAEELAQGTKEEVTPAEMAEREKALQALGYLGSSGEEGAAGASAAAGEESSPELHNNLGLIHLNRGETEQALAEFEKALAIDPRNADALLNIGSLKASQGRTVEAEHFVKRALAVNPNSAAALAQLGEIQRDLGNVDEAVRLFQEARAVDDSQPFVYLGLGDVLQRAGRYREAEEAFRRVLELDPDSFKARYNLGVTFANQGKLDEAERYYREALALNEQDAESPKAMNNLGFIELQRSRVPEAIAWFEKAVALSPLHFESRYNLAVQYLAQNRIAEAIELLEQAAALSPNHELVTERLGLAYLAAGRGEDAFRSFLLVRRLYPSNWVAPLELAELHAVNGRPEEARELLADALRLGGSEARSRAQGYAELAALLAAGP
jgi:tetratricopeptide (TPR) repeat protein